MMFTPGPWRVYQGWVHPSFEHPSPQGTNGDTAICEPLGQDKYGNAFLIAAAPDMYETLKEMFSKGAYHPGYVKRIENALAKAEGREQ